MQDCQNLHPLFFAHACYGHSPRGAWLLGMRSRPFQYSRLAISYPGVVFVQFEPPLHILRLHLVQVILDCTIDLLNFRVLPRHACLLHRRCTFFIDQANKSEMAAPIILERFVLKRRFCERKRKCFCAAYSLLRIKGSSVAAVCMS